MELVKTEQLNAPWQGMWTLPIVRQLGLLLGLVVTVVLTYSIITWISTPSYTVLHTELSGQTLNEVMAILDRHNIKHQVNASTGAIMVEADKLNEAKLKLAAENISLGAGFGFELIEKDQGFGTSSFLQTARYQRALEGELARTITSMKAVQSARVHLALPKESAFIRNHRDASASVMLKLVPGYSLDKVQINAISNLVASSIPDMKNSQVTIVDSAGNMLSSGNNMSNLAISASQFEYTRDLEKSYVARIERILMPLVGMNSVRAQVTAEMDFTQIESTQESYNPEQQAVRSEQSIEEQSSGVAQGGIPGALTNQPPVDATTQPQTTTQTTAQAPSRNSKRSTRNYELDKTISHTRKSPTTIRRLSVAVIVDNKQTRNDKGETVSLPYTQQELERITTLVKEAVGFNTQRGDSVNVVNAAFTPPEKIASLPDEPFYTQPWVKEWGTKLLAAVILLILLFGFLKPILHGLATRPQAPRLITGPGGEELTEDQLSLSGGRPRLAKSANYEESLQIAKSLAVQEPKRVAQVIKSWMGEEK